MYLTKIISISRTSRFSVFFQEFYCLKDFFTFRSLIHFEITFVKNIKSILILFFFFWHLDVQSLWHHVLKWNEEVTQLCPTLCGPVDCSLPGSSVHGVLQARILEWVAVSFSRGTFQSRHWTQVQTIFFPQHVFASSSKMLTMFIWVSL